MSLGLIALIDDVVMLARMAAASLDDVAALTGKAGAKAAGVVIDDAAVTPRYAMGFSAEREWPIIRRIAIGSLRNKLLILLPAALALSFLAPKLITPLLMLGGAYLAFEGAEKIREAIGGHGSEHGAGDGAPKDEDAMVSGAIKTDFILSAEIMAITLGAVEHVSPMMQAATLALVGVFITLAVYGTVGLLVKMDDFGLMLARDARWSFARAFGRGLVRAMPYALEALGIIGVLAMVWVGGGIIIHGLESHGLPQIAHGVHLVGEYASMTLPALPFVRGVAEAVVAGVFGLILGLLLLPVGHGISTLVAQLRRDSADLAK
ncbi:MAG: DUF808 domain-containing protein [Proteobacteria bacterium]|nr:DUF808 domain-containing protein [Pseudomonadota bacterium]